MMLKQVVVLVLLVAFGKSAEKGEECKDKWGQKGLCTNIQSCEIPLMNATVGERVYISGEVCGYSDKEPLVCCKISSSNGNPARELPRGFPSDSLSSTPDIAIGSRQEFEFTSPPLTNEETTNVIIPQNGNIPVEANSIPGPLPLEQSSSIAPFPVESTSIFGNTFSSLPTESIIFSPTQINKLLPDRTVCGFQNPRSRLESPSVSGLNEFPWTVLLNYRYGFGQNYNNQAGFRCLGTLISNRYVVTSARCVMTESESYSLESVRLGEWIISSVNDCILSQNGHECADKVVDVAVEKRIPHQDYDIKQNLNDIALVRLAKDIEFSESIRPICLPVEDLAEPAIGTILLTSGWGASKYGHQLDIKSKIGLPVLQKSNCPNQLLENQGCIGTTVSMDLCLTDSGAAVMGVSQEHKPQWYLEGVIPEGVVCNQQEVPETYTRVTAYVKWILDTISKDTV